MVTRSQTVKLAAEARSPPAAKSTATLTDKKGVSKMSRLNLAQNAKIGEFVTWYQMEFADKIQCIRSGLPAERVSELASVLGMPREALMDSLGLSRATVKRKMQREQVLSSEQSERVMGMQVLIGQVQSMIDTESEPEFDAAKWLASWLGAPLPALGGATPGSFMDTVEGQKYVGNLLGMTQSGAYS